MGIKFDRGLYRNGGMAEGMNYGQIEPNQVWFNRAGMVEAQCELDGECFANGQVAPETKYVAAVGLTPATKIVAQVGAFLMVDKANKTATIPNQTMSDAGFPMGINYSTEKLYNQFTPQRRKFYMPANGWLPRIGYTETGMRITTNTVQWDNTADKITDQATGAELDLSTFTTTADSYAMYQAVKTYLESGAKTPLYAVVTADSDGELVIGADPADAIGNVYAQVVKAYTNADRTCSFMFQIINEPA